MPEKTAIEVLESVWWVGAIALGASLILTPIVRLIAHRADIVDRPDGLLKPHSRPVAYLGGVAICLGLLVGLAGYVWAMPDAGVSWSELKGSLAGGQFAELLSNPLWNLAAVAIACVLITVVGLLDDLFDIAPKKKLLGQVAAAGILLIGGIGLRMADCFLLTFHWSVAPWVPRSLNSVLCVMVVLSACNATNLLDGLDGLCGGVTWINSIFFLVLAVWLAMSASFPGTDELRVGLSLAMAGAILGFLPYNIQPASIFLGDAGSMLLGFFVATMMVLFCQGAAMRWFLAAIVVFALPILDTTLALVRRLLAGKPIFAGDRSHLYDQLVDRGMSVKQVVALFYILSITAGLLGVLVAIYLRLRYAVIIYTILFVLVWILFFAMHFVRPKKTETGETHRS